MLGEDTSQSDSLFWEASLPTESNASHTQHHLNLQSCSVRTPRKATHCFGRHPCRPDRTHRTRNITQTCHDTSQSNTLLREDSRPTISNTSLMPLSPKPVIMLGGDASQSNTLLREASRPTRSTNHPRHYRPNLPSCSVGTPRKATHCFGRHPCRPNRTHRPGQYYLYFLVCSVRIPRRAIHCFGRHPCRPNHTHRPHYFHLNLP